MSSSGPYRKVRRKEAITRRTKLSFGYWDVSRASLAAVRRGRGSQRRPPRARHCAHPDAPLHVLLQDVCKLLQRGHRVDPELVGVAPLLQLHLEIMERRLHAGRAGLPPSGCHLELMQAWVAVCSGCVAEGGGLGTDWWPRVRAGSVTATAPRAAQSPLARK